MIWKNTLLHSKNPVMNRIMDIMIFMRHWAKGISSLSCSLKNWESVEENQDLLAIYLDEDHIKLMKNNIIAKISFNIYIHVYIERDVFKV